MTLYKSTPILYVQSFDTNNATLYLQNSTSGTTTGDGFALYINGSDGYVNVKESGSLYLQTAGTTRQTIDSSGAVTFAGAITHSSTTTNTGAVTCGSTLAVTGATTHTGGVTNSSTTTMTGAATCGSTLGVTGATTLASTLAVTGATTHTGAVTNSSTSTLTGAVTCGSTLGVTGATTCSSTLAVTGATTLSGDTTLTKATPTLTIRATDTTNASLYLQNSTSGSTTTDGFALYTATTAGVADGYVNVKETGSLFLQTAGTTRQTIDSTGAVTFAGAVTHSSTTTNTGAVTCSSTLGATGATTLGSTLGVTGATTLSSTLGVTGATTLNGDVTLSKITPALTVRATDTTSPTLNLQNSTSRSTTSDGLVLYTDGTNGYLLNKEGGTMNIGTNNNSTRISIGSTGTTTFNGQIYGATTLYIATTSTLTGAVTC